MKKSIFAICAAAIIAALAVSIPARAQSFGETVAAAADALSEARDKNASPESVKAIFAKAADAEEEGVINFCGFYLGISEADFQALVAHYGLKDGEWGFAITPQTKLIYKMTFTLQGVRRVTKGGNTFDELSQAVANRVGTMKPKRNDDYNLVGYEYKNIDAQTAFMSEKDGLVLTAGDLTQQAEVEAMAEASKGALSKLAKEMIEIPGKDYKMGKYEVTQALWFAVMGENPLEFKGADRPVEVSWDDCQKFIEKLNAMNEVKASGLVFRLPTEEEWEYACRAGATGRYCKLADGTEVTVESFGTVAWYEDNSDRQTHPVGQKKPNAFGLYDMHGNVWEWTSTTDNDFRVYRGGSWRDSAHLCGAGHRHGYFLDGRHFNFGFRLAARQGAK